jgi:hypothetical protein
MKKLQRLCIAGVFLLVLTTTAFAGDIHTPGITHPPPPVESSATTLGHIQPDGAKESPQAMSDSVVDIALNLLQTVLSRF